ncbi:hypothetical protein BH11PLA1_BH11PLA1_00100 [soil metagenome]
MPSQSRILPAVDPEISRARAAALQFLEPKPAPLSEGFRTQPAPRTGNPAAASYAAPGPASSMAASPLSSAIAAASAALFAKQRDDKPRFPGPHWCAELEGDSILSSEYILMKFILNQQDDPVERTRLPRIANQIRLSQRADASWGQYPGSPPDLSSCVKAYLVLKLMGDAPDAPHMARARALIRALGGAEAINTFSMFYLACAGIVSWNACPVIPPQIVLAPHWAPFHIRRMAAWTRTMILPLALCSALQPVRPLNVSIDELFLDPRKKRTLNKPWDAANPAGWTNVFLTIDRILKGCRRIGFTPLRRRAIRLCEAWIARRMHPETTEGLGAIFPPMVYVQIAFQKLGYPRSHPLLQQAEKDLDAFMIDEPNPDPRLDHIRLQPCFSPVWDTAIAIDALTETGVTAASDERLAASCDWLRAREVRHVGDWIDNLRPAHRHLIPGVDMACWAFEYRNDWYPDVDDTCMVARALHKAGDRPGQHANTAAAVRAVQWIIAMQNDDGGWAAFDRTRDRPWMEAVPFADHNAMQDPSCSDVTGRVLESLIVCGLPPSHPAIRAGVKYILATQHAAGPWWGRWGNNYLYGTWQAISGLTAGGLTPDHPALQRVRAWLFAHQNADGGFGESANSYLDATLMGQGPSTPSQTSWALMTLINLPVVRLSEANKSSQAPDTSTDFSSNAASSPPAQAFAHITPPAHADSQLSQAIHRAAEYLLAQQLTTDKPAFTKAQVASSSSPAFPVAVGQASRLPGNDSNSAAASIPSPAERWPRDPVTDLAGAWAEHEFTGTGFPKVFYLRYHLYRHSFPLKALARYSNWCTRQL